MILDRRIGAGEPCLIIAEAGLSHFGDIEKGKELVDMAVESGADVFKTQSYSTDRLIASDLGSWKNRMRSKEVDLEFLQVLKERCVQSGIIFMCTAHDEVAFSWLDVLDVAAYKIGSGEKGNHRFIRQHAEKKKPLIISTGMQDEVEILETVQCVNASGNRDLAIMHCITSYPTPPDQVNLNSLLRLKAIFSGPVGYSDHCKGTLAVLGAVGLGANIVEKHISLDFNVPDAQDWKVAANRDELTSMVVEIRQLESMLGSASLEIQECESSATKWALKRLVSRKALNIGDVIDESNILSKRAGSGILSKDLEKVIGLRLTKPISNDSPLHWEDLG